MAIFHFTVKIVGRSKGKSIISASAYLNGDVMKNEEAGRASDYTSKKEVVYSQLEMCENVPPVWSSVSGENLKSFMRSVRYKRAEDKEAAIEKFRLTYQKQKLWNEVLKVEKGTNAQLGRAFEFSLPREWSRQAQIAYTTNFIQRNFVAQGMCADWSIHDKGDGNPHVHLLVTMRPFTQDHTWGNKETKDWEFVRDTKGDVVIDLSHQNWWQDKKNPSHQGIRIPVLDSEGNQKVGSRNRKQWKRVLVDATGWNNLKNCELWRSEWEKECNLHLPKEKWVDHRSFERQGRTEIPTIHEGAGARKIDEKYHDGKNAEPSWKVAENQVIKRQNAILRKLQKAFQNVAVLLQYWKERLYDFRREQGSHSHVGGYDNTDRRTAGTYGRDVSGIENKGQPDIQLSGTESRIGAVKRRIAETAHNFTRYRRDAESYGNAGQQDKRTGNRKSAMERISGAVKQREHAITIAERRITEAKCQIEKVGKIDERISRLKARRTNAGTIGLAGGDADRSRPEGRDNNGTAGAAERINGIKREAEQREQSRERAGIKERLEANRRIAEERAKAGKRSHYHDRGTSR